VLRPPRLELSLAWSYANIRDAQTWYVPAAQVKQEEAQSLRKVDAFNLQEEYWVRT